MKLFPVVLLVLFAVGIYAQTCPRCVPYCFRGDGSAKFCGGDGCGGSCGTCGFGQECCRGVCSCSPVCNGRQCGDDGCGGTSCGSCADGQVCQNGFCQGVATRSCNGKQCGRDRAGGSCGTCATGQRCRAGACECHYDCNDRNCGTAVMVAGSVCPTQTCGTCPSGYTCGTNGQCSQTIPCNGTTSFTATIVITDRITSSTLQQSCTVDIQGVNVAYTRTGFVWSPPSTSWDVVNGPGSYSFTTRCAGYQVNTQSFTVSSSASRISLSVTPAPIPVEVYQSGSSSQLSGQCTISVSGANFYHTSFSWSAFSGVVFQGVTSNGFGLYEFTTSCSGFADAVQTLSLTSATSIIQLFVSSSTPVGFGLHENVPPYNLIRVTASIEITDESGFSYQYFYDPSGTNQWFYPHTGNFTFVAKAQGYYNTRAFYVITDTTTSISFYLDPKPSRSSLTTECAVGDLACENENENQDLQTSFEAAVVTQVDGSGLVELH